ncbi:MAG: glycoside hydrolase family 16 protein [Marmoricola sp.]|nr:glycoside hydrolase family 16 protein [Marmoricola sp.]
MRYLVALVMGLTGTLVPVAAAQASTTSVSLTAPATHHAGKPVVVSGKVKGKAQAVRIQQRKAGKWVLVKTAKVTKGAFRTSVSASAASTQLRASAPGTVSKAVTVTAVPAPATDACGTILKKADGTNWSCTFDDEFNGTTLDRTSWMPQTAFAMGTQAAHTCYADDPSTINVSGGSLNLTMRKVATPVTCSFGGLTGPTNYVSGGVMSYRLFSQQFGRFEARIKNTATNFPGLHEAFWLWPDDRVASKTVWPYAGEMDISETYSSYPTLSIPFLHYSADVYGNLVGTNTAWNCVAPRGAWNTYALEWTATQVQVIVNGKTCLTNKSGNAAFLKPYIMALTQGMGAAGNVYDGRAPLPATMNVDYVKVWK